MCIGSFLLWFFFFFFNMNLMHVLRSPGLSPLRPEGAVPKAHDIVGAHETVFISLKIRRKKEMNF